MFIISMELSAWREQMIRTVRRANFLLMMERNHVSIIIVPIQIPMAMLAFGRVVVGIDVVRAIAEVETMTKYFL